MTKATKKPADPEEAVVVEPVETKSVSSRVFSVGSIFWGFAFIGFGALLLLDNLGVFDVHFGNLWQLWPVLIIGAGVSMLSLRGWIAGVVSFVLVVALGVLVWLVAVDNPFTASTVSSRGEHSVIDGSALLEKELDLTLRTGALKLDMTSTPVEQGYSAQLWSRGLVLNRAGSESRDSIKYVTLETSPKNEWWLGLGNLDSQLVLELTEQLPLSLHIETGASTITGDLSSAQLKALTLKAGVSSISLRFGAQQAKQDVTLEAGASSVTLYVPKDAGVRVEADNGLSHTDFGDLTKQSDGVYESAGFSSADKQIVVHAKVGVSSFELQRY